MKCYFCAILNQMCKNRMEQEHQFIDYIEQSIIKNWDKDALTDYKGITLQYKTYLCAVLTKVCNS